MENIDTKNDMFNCPVCGNEQVEIRARYPKGAKRLVCPTCLQDRMDQIDDLSSREWIQNRLGVAATPLRNVPLKIEG